MSSSEISTDQHFPPEYRDFKAALDEGTSDALLAYLLNYPESPFRDVIILKLSQLRAGVNVTQDSPAPRTPRRRGMSFASFALGAATSSVIFLAIGGYAAYQYLGVSSTRLLASNEAEFETQSISIRRNALIDASRAFGRGSFSDDEALAAIRASRTLTSEEIEADTELLPALERILDAFFSAERFDFVAQLEETHGELFKRDRRFYVSFCLSYGLHIISTPSNGTSIWTVDDIEAFNGAVAKYEEYSSLESVRRSYPEYAVMFDPFILKLQGADDAAVSEQMNKVAMLEGADLSNFTRTMEIYATGRYTSTPERPSVQLASSRIKELIQTYASQDSSGQWRRVGLLAGLDL